MSEHQNAVFLSYASQDSEAAKRLCEALRAAGVEVWFDQNELVGGDVWDQKIRGQISTCALFVPLISANTQARREGYFRIEWKLAAQRTHAMADGTPFLLPVLIDGTRDSDALVPAEFRAVQWTKLPAGETPPVFTARVQKLLRGEHESSGTTWPLDSLRGTAGTAPPMSHVRGPSRWWWVPAIFGVFMALLLVLRQSRPGTSTPETPIRPETSISAARALADKATAMVNGKKRRPEVFRAAMELADKATVVDPLDGEVWALGALVDLSAYEMNLDLSDQRREGIRTKINKAKGLAPESLLTRTAEAKAFIVMEHTDESLKAGIELLRVFPANDTTALGLTGIALQHQGHFVEAAQTLEKARWTNAAGWAWLMARNIPKAKAIAEAQVEEDPVVGLTQLSAVEFARGDLVAAQAALDRLPPSAHVEEEVLCAEIVQAFFRRDASTMLRLAQLLPSEFINNVVLQAPKRWFVGQAQELAGREKAAREEWTEALRLVEERLAARPKEPVLNFSRLFLLAKLGRREEVGRELDVFLQSPRPPWIQANSINLLLMIGRENEALDKLERYLRAPDWPAFNLHTWARYSPAFDSLRGNPRLEKLLRETLPPGAKPFDDEKKATAPTTDEKSLVVLPLENLSPDPENAFFTDGMHSEIISVLSRSTDLKVISRATALAFKGSNLPLAQVAQKLGVANVIVGTVRRAGDRVRVELELRRASDEAVLWQSPKVERKLTDIFALQTEIAEDVARALQARASLTQADQARFSTRNPEAYDLFLKANQVFFGYQPNAFEATIPLGSAALDLDPNFAVAAFLVTAAHCNIVDHSRDPALRVQHADEAKRWASKTASLDPTTGAKATAIYCLTVTRDFPQALEMSERILRVLPHDEAGLTFRGWALVRLGRASEAFDSFRRAREQDPLNRFTVSNELDALVLLRRHADVETAISRLPISVTPDPAGGAFYRRIIREARFRLKGEIATVTGEFTASEKLETLWAQRKYSELAAEAAAILKGAKQDDPGLIRAQFLLHDALKRERRDAEAAVAARELLANVRNLKAVPDLDPSSTGDLLAEALARNNDVEGALGAMRDYLAALPQTSISDLWIRQRAQARLFAYLHRNQESIALLSKLLRVPSQVTIGILRADPCWDNIRGDAAFEALLTDPANNAPL